MIGWEAIKSHLQDVDLAGVGGIAIAGITPVVGQSGSNLAVGIAEVGSLTSRSEKRDAIGRVPGLSLCGAEPDSYVEPRTGSGSAISLWRSSAWA